MLTPVRTVQPALETLQNYIASYHINFIMVNIPFTALRYFKTFEKALIMDMNG